MTVRLLAISDRSGLPGMPIDDWAAAVAAAGVDHLQLREKDLADRAVVDLARALGARLVASDCRLLVNGRVDLALAAGAAGAHLPAAELAGRRLVGRWPGLLLGRSAHTIEEVRRAATCGAGYVTFGPVFATPGRGKAPPCGLAALTEAAACGVPVIALGGVGLDDLPAVAATGAAGVAGIRLFRQPERLAEVVIAAREAFA
jgi:thiamine-phosphate pyrophosphorylase